MEKRRECGTGTKAADLSRIKNIPLEKILFFFFFSQSAPQKVLRGSREAPLSAEATVLFLCHYVFKKCNKDDGTSRRVALKRTAERVFHTICGWFPPCCQTGRAPKHQPDLAFLVRCCWSRDRTCSSESSARQPCDSKVR